MRLLKSPSLHVNLPLWASMGWFKCLCSNSILWGELTPNCTKMLSTPQMCLTICRNTTDVSWHTNHQNIIKSAGRASDTQFSLNVSRDVSILNTVKRKEQFKLLRDCWAIKHRPHLMFQVRRGRKAGLIVKGLVLHKSTSDFAFLKTDSPSSSPPLLPSASLFFISLSWANAHLFINWCLSQACPLETQAARHRGSLLQSERRHVVHSTLPKQERVKQSGTDFYVYIS